MVSMQMLMQRLRRVCKNEKGAVAIEYALLAALIALAIGVGAQALGISIGGLFTNIATSLDGATVPAVP